MSASDLALKKLSYLKASRSATSVMHGSKVLSVAAIIISLGSLITSALVEWRQTCRERTWQMIQNHLREAQGVI